MSIEADPSAPVAPTGKVALVFTSIHDSTQLWERAPDAMREALSLHDDLLRRSLGEHGGYEVRTEGDAFMVAVGDPVAAVRACLTAQERLAVTRWPDGLGPSGLRVRMGIHLGEPVCRSDPLTGRMDYHGPVVHKSARIASAAHGGQVLCSGAVWDAVAPALAGEVAHEELGLHRLKGVVSAERLVQVLPMSLAGRGFPPPRTEGAIADRPYRGLESFGPDDGGRFFGRDEEITRLAARVSAHPIVTVTGPSGAGKSSLLRAGMPRGLRDHRVVVLRPGGHPADALVAALADFGVKRTHDASEVVARVTGSSLVIVVDQLEELLTICGDPAEQDRFGALLVRLAGPCRVVLSVRDDFFARLATIPSLGRRIAEVVEVVVPPTRRAMIEAVARPAALFGYGFDDPSLPERMVDEVGGEPGALPLLQFCADQLWDRRDQGARLMRSAEYDALGGVGGALARHADAVVGGLSTAQQREARAIVRRLVTPEGTRAIVPIADLADGAIAPGVLERLVAARLVAVRDDADGGATAELVHEALVRHWGMLQRWLAEDRVGLQILQSLRTAAREWHRRGRPALVLWRGEVLDELATWRRRTEASLSEAELAFVAASLNAQVRTARARRWVIWFASTALVWFGAVMAGQWRLSASAYEDARLRALLADARAQEAAGHGNAAVALLRLATAIDPAQGEMTRTLGELARVSWAGAPHHEVPVGAAIEALSIAGDVVSMATERGPMGVDLTTGAGTAASVIGATSWEEGRVAIPGVCADARGHVSAGSLHLVRCGASWLEVWDGPDRVVREQIGRVTAASVEGSWIVAATDVGVAHAWRREDLARAVPWTAATVAAQPPDGWRVAVDGGRIVATGPDGPQILADGAEPFRWAVLSPQPLRVIATRGRRIEGFQLSGTPPRTWSRRVEGTISSLTMSPVGEWFLVREAERAAVWHARTGLVLAEVAHHGAPIGFAADATHLVVGDRAWPLSRPRRIALVPSTGERSNLRVCAGSQQVVAVVPWPDPSTVEAPPGACE